MYQHNENSGSMFRNENKKDAQPCFTGTCLIDGKKYKIAAWTKQGKTEFYSMKFQPFDEKAHIPGKPQVKADPIRPSKEQVDELPF
jgi:hypothetical protein